MIFCVHFARFRPSKQCTPNEGSCKTVGEQEHVQVSDLSFLVWVELQSSVNLVIVDEYTKR